MTGFYPRKLLSNEYMSLNKLLFTKLQFIKNIAVSNIIIKKRRTIYYYWIYINVIIYNYRKYIINIK